MLGRTRRPENLSYLDRNAAGVSVNGLLQCGRAGRVSNTRSSLALVPYRPHLQNEVCAAGGRRCFGSSCMGADSSLGTRSIATPKGYSAVSINSRALEGLCSIANGTLAIMESTSVPGYFGISGPATCAAACSCSSVSIPSARNLGKYPKCGAIDSGFCWKTDTHNSDYPLRRDEPKPSSSSQSLSA